MDALMYEVPVQQHLVGLLETKANLVKADGLPDLLLPLYFHLEDLQNAKGLHHPAKQNKYKLRMQRQG